MQDAAPCGGKLLEAINRDFGSLDALKTKMSADSAGVQVCMWRMHSTYQKLLKSP
jgi:superoxide dismutase